MAGSGVELALGLVNDPQFGPLVMVAAGGVLIEVLRDAAHALAPFGVATARASSTGSRSASCSAASAARRRPISTRLRSPVARFSVLAADLADVIAECDVNPLIAGPEGAVAVDALVIARQET